jgi:hypothetical protein
VGGLSASGSGKGHVAGSCEHGHEPSAFIKGGEFLDYLNDYELLKMDFAPWSESVIQSATQFVS